MTLTNEQKTQITCLYDAGLNNAKIAEQLMIHRNTVAKWLLYYTNNIPMLNKQRLISKPENDIVLEGSSWNNNGTQILFIKENTRITKRKI